MKKKPSPAKIKPSLHPALLIAKSIFWFATGVILGLFFLISFGIILFQRLYGNMIYPGITINGVNFGGKSKEAVTAYFDKKNRNMADTEFTLVKDDTVATTSARQLQMGYDSRLLAQQAFDIGRSKYPLSNFTLILQSYFNGLPLRPAYMYSQEKLLAFLAPMIQRETIAPKDAQFTFQNGRVVAFQLSTDGQAVDVPLLENIILSKIPSLTAISQPQSITLALPVKTVKPRITSESINNLGIKEEIGTGTSLFKHSIDSRIFNIAHGTEKINGIIVAPNEVFSFDKAVGDVSNLTGYKQAYVIVNGKTVLGDGGGICQVSTTLFRALLNAGLPIVERHGHAYRVGYYEEDAPPGIDATIFVPSVDLKFKNDTGHAILIQAVLDLNELRLTFNLYGTRDGRTVSMTQPVITNQTPAPPDVFQDDPTLPVGVVKQVDFAAAGAHVSFSRTVMKNNAVYLSDKFDTNYQPWTAVFLRGTKTQ